MTYFYLFIAIVPSIVLHEVSHGYVAYLFGDPTAKEQHRLTLNPLRHVDPFGTVLLPALLLMSGLPAFGYAKPVPVNVSRLRNPRTQSLYVSLAGPLVNVVLSAVGFGICEFAMHVTQSQVTLNIGVSLGLVNLMLAVFNMLPIPPLDGSALIERFIPNRHMPRYYQLRAKALPIVMGLVILDSFFFHFGGNALTGLQNWWISRLF
ncbi:MAG TPA: site-2 protease family protein [Acidimicrobiales bacterium]|nr:site-2 protease family protein [Acidimicrobiales bacterium]